MSFQFSLAAVLRIRVMVEEREERLLQQIVSEIRQAVVALERTSCEITEGYASMAQRDRDVIAGHHLHAAYGQVGALIESRKDLEGHLEKLQELRNKQRLVYEAARRQREMLTDMHQERKSAYQVEAARREQKVLDDNHIAKRRRS